MKRELVVSICTVLVIILFSALIIYMVEPKVGSKEVVKVGFIYNGDESVAYSNNFAVARNQVKKEYGKGIKIYEVKNVSEDKITDALKELTDDECDIIFSNSFEFGDEVKEYAKEHKDIEFCQATCSNANQEPVVKNYHTFMGEIYEGRYVSGVVAGIKIKDMISKGELDLDDTVVGCVASFPCAEVVSGYTAFLMGVRSVEPTAVLKVVYANTWSDYSTEYECAKKLIDAGCVVICQHTDTIGPAVACEETDGKNVVYHIGYNETMINIAPTTSLVSCRIDWEPYISGAIGAVIDGKSIEKAVKGNVHGNDIGAGFDQGWVEMKEINDLLLPSDTNETITKLIQKFKKGDVHVFVGNYEGVSVDDPNDTINLDMEYIENEKSSAPSFDYVLKDVVEIIE
ncbi:MAG: BMP family ABC transporter substrate-binding protein [Lachnospiraceae bacterium]|nr:BMP family ABC transporter substrate-binding protein [Lachnospiraceae bacterium]